MSFVGNLQSCLLEPELPDWVNKRQLATSGTLQFGFGTLLACYFLDDFLNHWQPSGYI